MANTKMTAKATKIDQTVPPGGLMGARITIGGNGGCTVDYEHAPEKQVKGMDPFSYKPRRPDIFGSIEEACHAIVQAAGGTSEMEYEKADEAEDAADAKKGKAA